MSFDEVLSILRTIDAGSHLPDCPPLDFADFVTIVAIGIPAAVRETIEELERRGFADREEWSEFAPAPTPGEVLSILMKPRTVPPHRR